MARDLLTGFTSEADMLQKVWDSGGWFLTPLDLFLATSLEEGVVLSFLINKKSMNTKERKRKGKPASTWFQCTTLSMELNLHITAKVQQRILRSLKRKNILQTKLMGIPPRRYFQIDFAEISRRIVEGNLKQGTC